MIKIKTNRKLTTLKFYFLFQLILKALRVEYKDIVNQF